jgi:hypothetical protein
MGSEPAALGVAGVGRPTPCGYGAVGDGGAVSTEFPLGRGMPSVDDRQRLLQLRDDATRDLGVKQKRYVLGGAEKSERRLGPALRFDEQLYGVGQHLQGAVNVGMYELFVSGRLGVEHEYRLRSVR